MFALELAFACGFAFVFFAAVRLLAAGEVWRFGAFDDVRDDERVPLPERCAGGFEEDLETGFFTGFLDDF